jgi:hypothetical protein
MTDFPSPPGTPPSPLPPSIPAGAPGGHPTLWRPALLFLAAGVTAGACAVYSGLGGSAGDALALLSVATAPIAAGAFVLLAFRLWRRRAREAWPSLAQCLLIAVAGVVLGVGGCGGFLLTLDASSAGTLSVVLGGVFVVGAAIVLGAGELLLIGIVRLILKKPGAR